MTGRRERGIERRRKQGGKEAIRKRRSASLVKGGERNKGFSDGFTKARAVGASRAPPPALPSIASGRRRRAAMRTPRCRSTPSTRATAEGRSARSAPRNLFFVLPNEITLPPFPLISLTTYLPTYLLDTHLPTYLATSLPPVASSLPRLPAIRNALEYLI